jgi:DNA polymerase III subunit chi
MTRIDFYLLPATEDDSKQLAACRLAHKAFRLGHRIYILAPNAAESAALDQLLWTFQPGSFIPHKVNGTPAEPETPVVIGHDAPPDGFSDVLISLAPQVPEGFERFARIAELVAPSESERAAARERFRFYRDRGHDVQTHNI